MSYAAVEASMLGLLLRVLLVVWTLMPTLSNARTAAERLHQSLTLQQQGQGQEALRLLQHLERPETLTEALGRLYFLRARLAAYMPEVARTDWQYLFQAYPPLADYAAWHLLQYWAAQDHLEQMETVLTTLSTHYPFSLWLPEAYLLLAQTQARLGQPASALATLEQLRHTRRPASPPPAALWLLAQLYEENGQLKPAAETLRQLGETYPTHTLATEALQRSTTLLAQLPVEQRPVPEPEQLLASLDGLIQARQWPAVETRLAVLETFTQPPDLVRRVLLKRATVALRRQMFEAARTALVTLLQHYPQGEHVAEALYRLGQVEQQQGKTALSDLQYRRVFTEYAASPWAADALATLAQRLEERQDFAGAEALYRQLARQFPAHEKVEEGLWRLGWRYYTAQRYETAEELFRHFASLIPDAELLPQVLYWQARALQQRGQPQTAAGLYRRIVDDYPFHYYRLHAAEALQRLPGSGRSTTRSAAPGTAWKQPAPVLLPAVYPAQPSETQFHLIRVQELQQLHLYQEAASEIRFLTTLLPEEPATQYFLGTLWAENQDYLPAFRHFYRLLNALRPDEVRGLPQKFWTLLYPRVFWPEATQQARTNRLNPYLVLSVIRQESAFQPRAVSTAGAIGLMQLLPSTARMLARQLGLGEITTDMLMAPQLNLTLGTRYFASMLQRYHGNVFFALAAYNAGPGRMDRWQKQWAGLPMDEFVESIPFRETRLYVKLALRNLLNYESLYKNLPDG